MMLKLVIFLLAAFILGYCDDDIIPCRSYISFSYDESNTLPAEQFKTQMSFIKNIVGALDNPAHLRVQGAYYGKFGWHSGLSIPQMVDAFDESSQSNFSYSLSKQAQNLFNSIQSMQNFIDPIPALIFISDTSDAALANADQWIPQLWRPNITFILMGKNVDSKKLKNWNANFIEWSNLAQSQSDNWDAMASGILGCDLSTSQIPTPIVPCRSYIGFAYDDSVTLDGIHFRTQMNFIKSVIGNLNNPAHIRVEGGYWGLFNWYSRFSISQLQHFIDEAHQKPNTTYSLGNQAKNLFADIQGVANLVDRMPILIFVSDTSAAALTNADQWLSQIWRAEITFVMMGTKVDSTKLIKYSSSFLYWPDLEKPQPDNWDAMAFGILGCNLTPPVYSPCKSWIYFAYDDSNFLQNAEFRTQMKFISSAIESIDHPKRLQVAGALTIANGWTEFGTPPTIAHIQEKINGTKQSANSYALMNQFAFLAESLGTIENSSWPISALLFIPDTSDEALRNANLWISQLSAVKLTFVMMGTDVNSSKLEKYSTNFIFWSNLTNPQPDNWDALSYGAFGCDLIASPLPSSQMPQSSSTLSTRNVFSAMTSSGFPATPPSSTTSPSTLSTTQEAYNPCKSWISISFDDSNTLEHSQFLTQMNFISSIFGTINYPNRLRLQGTLSIAEIEWNSTDSIAQIQDEIHTNIRQTEFPYTLSFVEYLAYDVRLFDDKSRPFGLMIFISDTSDLALLSADIYFDQLSGIPITFVLLGEKVESKKLEKYASNFIYWTNFSRPQPDNWDYINSDIAFGCKAPSTSTLMQQSTIFTSSKPPPTSISMQSSTAFSSTSTMRTYPSASLVPSLTSTTFPSTSTTANPYIPCKSWISFGIDDSNQLSAEEFSIQLKFILSVIESLNYPERLQFIGANYQPVPWNSGLSLLQVYAAVNGFKQVEAYSLQKQFINLISNLHNLNPNGMPVNAIIFVSDTSDKALEGATQLLPQLSGIRLTLVQLGPNAEWSKLNQFTQNIIFWPSLQYSEPGDWSNKFYNASGC